jgi:hypothetical protein
MFPDQFFARVFFSPVYWERPGSTPEPPVYASGIWLPDNGFCRVIVRVNRKRR